MYVLVFLSLSGSDYMSLCGHFSGSCKIIGILPKTILLLFYFNLGFKFLRFMDKKIIIELELFVKSM